MLNIGKTKRIHFIGIGGIGMSGMAELLASSGYIITGSDLESNDREEFLSSINIDINIGHSKKNIDNADLVVFSSAVDINNIEILICTTRKLRKNIIFNSHMISG